MLARRRWPRYYTENKGLNRITRRSDGGAHLVHMTRSAVPSFVWSAFDRKGIIGVVEKLTCVVGFIGESMQLSTLDNRHRRSTLLPLQSACAQYGMS